MKYLEIEEHLSNARLNRYNVATNNNKAKTVRLYKANLRLAQAFHPLLGLLEVVLRNAINKKIVNFFNDPNWILNQRGTTGLLRVGNNYLLQEVEKVERRLRRLNIPVTSNKVIAEQTLGFWVFMFDVPAYRDLEGTPVQIFNNLPSGYNRRKIHDYLTNIRNIRNRINHNEPICFVGGQKDISVAQEAYQNIIELLSLLDNDLLSFIRGLDKVPKELAKINQI